MATAVYLQNCKVLSMELCRCAGGECVQLCLHVGWQVGGWWSDQGRDGTAAPIRDQWVENSEYHECLDPTAMGNWERVLRKRVE